jgi:hypothetical protein
MTKALLLSCSLCVAMPGALLPSCEEEPAKPDSGDSSDADTDADGDTDSDTDADSDADTDLGVVELVSSLDGVDEALGPFDPINSMVSCSGSTWSFEMLDSQSAADQGWVVGWNLADMVMSPPQAMSFDSGSRNWVLSVSTADMGIDCEDAAGTVIYFLPIAGNMLGKKAATKTGTCTGTGFGQTGSDYLINVSTSSPVDSATAYGLHMFSGLEAGPITLNELSADTWDSFFQWPKVELSTMAQEAMFGFVLVRDDQIVGVGGW